MMPPNPVPMQNPEPEYHGIRAGAMLCTRAPGLFSWLIRWMLSHSFRCHTSHNEVVCYSTKSMYRLAILVTNPPASKLVPIEHRMAQHAKSGTRLFAMQPGWVTAEDHDPAMLREWRREFTKGCEERDGADYAEDNIAAFACRILAKFPLIRWPARWYLKKRLENPYFSFHCTQGALDIYAGTAYHGWTPQSMKLVSPKRRSPKTVEHSIRCDEWVFSWGDERLWEAIRQEGAA